MREASTSRRSISSVTGEPKAGPAAFWRTVIDRVRQTPAVESASLARVPPGGFEGIGLGGVAPGDQPGTPEMFSPAWNIVDTGYFATLRIPIVAGRDFAPTDTAGAPPVVIVSETLARRFWPGQPAIGKPLRLAVFNAATAGVRTAARDGRWRRRRHPIEQPDRRPCRTVRLPAAGAK